MGLLADPPWQHCGPAWQPRASVCGWMGAELTPSTDAGAGAKTGPEWALSTVPAFVRQSLGTEAQPGPSHSASHTGMHRSGGAQPCQP